MQVMIGSRHVWGWCIAILGAAVGVAMVWFVFRGGRSGVSLMTELVSAGAIAGLGLGALVGAWRLKQPRAASSSPTGDWRDFFRRH